MMRGRPSPFLSLALAVWLLVPAALGGVDDGPAPPTAPETSTEPLASHPAAPSHLPLPAERRASDVAADPYADLVVAFRPGDQGAASGDPTWTLGPPGVTALGLGPHGCVIVAFTDLVIPNDPLDPRADLRVFEHQTGYAEYAYLDVSADGIRFERYGLVNGGTRDLDLAERIDTRDIRFVRFTDWGQNVYTTTHTSGYDVRGVEARVYDPQPDPTLGHIQDTGVRAAACQGPL